MSCRRAIHGWIRESCDPLNYHYDVFYNSYNPTYSYLSVRRGFLTYDWMANSITDGFMTTLPSQTSQKKISKQRSINYYKYYRVIVISSFCKLHYRYYQSKFQLRRITVGGFLDSFTMVKGIPDRFKLSRVIYCGERGDATLEWISIRRQSIDNQLQSTREYCW